MTFVDAIKSGFINYVNFRGRASRPEFWYWALFYVLVSLVAGTIDQGMQSTTVGNLVTLAFFLPNLTIGVRRFRDAGVNPWLQLLQIVPVIILIWLIAQAVATVLGLGGNVDQIMSVLSSNDPTAFEGLAEIFGMIMLPLLLFVVSGIGISVFFLIVYVRPSIPDSSSSARTHNFGDTTA